MTVHLDLDAGRVTAWPTTPKPKPTAWMRLRERLFGPDDHTGADTPDWDQELRTMRLNRANAFAASASTGRHYADNIATTVIRKPVAALTATGHYAVYDEHLGGLNPGPLEPAYLAGETSVGEAS